ncbi:MAG: Gfo/Idh/MocA family oxidoreductase, partial [Deltaproteobacteria bacterium]|nr:Gfo/Idh/MocA family oxidoreductase [Deltaproteobacteria bacterium]
MAKDADHVVKAAIIGLGWWGRIMVDAVQGQSNNMCFTHGAVRNREPVREFAEQRKLMLHSSLDEILALSEIDVVVLATPHSVHVEQIIACAEAGKPVFSEKPLALTLDEAKRAVDAC